LIHGSFDPGFSQIFANFSFQANFFFVTLSEHVLGEARQSNQKICTKFTSDEVIN